MREILSDIEAEVGALRDAVDDLDGTKFGDLDRAFNKMAQRCDRIIIAVRAAQQAESDR
jgi:hypothetical protein